MRDLRTTKVGGKLLPDRGFFPKGWQDAALQLGLLVVVDLGYELVRGLAAGKASVALPNGRAIADLEKSTGTFFEPTVQAFFLSEQWFIEFWNYFYMNCQFTLTAAVVFWLYIYRNDSYYFVRNMFIIGMGIALVIHAIWPVAPPRLLTEYGFVDTINDLSSVNQDSGAVKLLINPYAALPSMHIAFSLFIGVPTALVSKHLASKIFWLSYPLLVFFSIVVTANHFWIDAAAGALVAALAASGSYALGKAKPRPWAWRAAPQPAT